MNKAKEFQRGLGSPLLAVVFAILVVGHGEAFAALRTWTGANSGSWSDGGNWGGVAPIAGDDLVFPAGAANTTNSNDIAAGTSFNSISISDVGYAIGGNAVVLAAANALTINPSAPGSVNIGLPMTVSNAAAAITLSAPISVTQTVTLSGPITITGGSLAFDVGANVATLIVNGAIGESGGAAALVKSGEGLLRLAGNNTYSGTTTVNQGYLLVAADTALGAGTNAPGDGTVVNSGGSLSIVGAVAVANERLVLNGPGQSGNGALQTGGSGLASWGGELVLNTPNIAFNMLGQELTITGRVTGTGDLSFGRSTLVLTNPANDYGGSTTIGDPSGGTSVLRLGADNVIPDSSGVVLLEGTFDVNGRTETVGSIAGNPGTTLAMGSGGLLRTGDSASTTFDGTITGSGSLVKLGTGTFTLTAISPFSGVLTIAQGTLSMAPGSDLAAASVSFSGGGTLAGNNGHVDMVAAAAGLNGTVSPGIPGPGTAGTLSTDAFQLNSGNVLAVDLNGTSPGTQYDQIVVTPSAPSSVALGGTLSASLGFAASVGQVFRIVDNQGGNAVSGTFSGLPEGSTVTVGATQLQVSYVGGTGNDVTLTVTTAGPGAPTITTNSPLPSGTVGVAYSTTLAASGGTPPYSWSVTSGSLPAGLSLNASTGAITGTPTTAGTANFTVTVTDNASATANKPFALTIAPAALSIATPSPLPSGAVGAAYATTLAASGGTPPYAWSVTAGALPAGLSLNPSTGAITGTPTAQGTFNFTVTVTDNASGTASAPYALTIGPAAPTAPPAPIPVLGPWMLGLLSVLLAVFGMRRR